MNKRDDIVAILWSIYIWTQYTRYADLIFHHVSGMLKHDDDDDDGYDEDDDSPDDDCMWINKMQ